jgi:hypothetical protein
MEYRGDNLDHCNPQSRVVVVVLLGHAVSILPWQCWVGFRRMCRAGHRRHCRWVTNSSITAAMIITADIHIATHKVHSTMAFECVNSAPSLVAVCSESNMDIQFRLSLAPLHV